MNNKTLTIVVAVIIIIGALFWFNSLHQGGGSGMVMSDVKNTTYVVDGKQVTLKDGVYEAEAAPGSASKITTKYFGNEATGDLNGDGVDDTAFLITQDGGGSGTFFYLVAALKEPAGYVGTNAVLLGDRIAPQTTEYRDGGIMVNYAIRKAGEPMTTQPSIGVSKYFKMVNGELSEVAYNFEGESNPDQMTLGMKKWEWQNTMYNNDTKIVPKKPGAFTLTFESNGHVTVGTDCNSMGGSYATTTNKKITFSQMISTMMACQGSQEADFKKTLDAIDSYHFTSKGELVFDLKMDSGTAVFK